MSSLQDAPEEILKVTNKRKSNDQPVTQVKILKFFKKPEDLQNSDSAQSKDIENASNHGNETSQEPGNNTTNNNTDISNSNQKTQKSISRKFQHKWLVLYPWLKYTNESNLMTCRVCINAGRKNMFTEGSKNFKTSALSDHQKSNDHQTALIIPKLQNDMTQAHNKAQSDQEKGAIVGLKIIYWLVKETLPLVKFKSLVAFLKELETPYVQYLSISDHLNYDSSYTALEFLEACSKTLEDKLVDKLQNSPAITALSDESTDIAVNKRMVIYCQISDPVTMKPSTHFVTNIHLHEATGKAIADEIFKQFNKRGITPTKITGLGSDGASVMTGTQKGATGMMMRQNPHLVNVHCVAHRLALCTSQAADKIAPLKVYQETVTSLYYYFKYSANRVDRLHQIQEILDAPQLKYKEVHSVRWMSFFTALETVYRTLDPLLVYLAETGTNDAKAGGLKKKVK